MFIIRLKVRKTCTPKNFEKCIIWFMAIEIQKGKYALKQVWEGDLANK